MAIIFSSRRFIVRLKQDFPGVYRGQIDQAKANLKTLLNGETYGLTWKGKSNVLCNSINYYQDSSPLVRNRSILTTDNFIEGDNLMHSKSYNGPTTAKLRWFISILPTIQATIFKMSSQQDKEDYDRESGKGMRRISHLQTALQKIPKIVATTTATG